MMDNTNLKSRMGAKVQAISGQESIHLPADTGSDYIALTHNALDIIRENLKNQPLSFQLFDLVDPRCDLLSKILCIFISAVHDLY